MSVKMLTVKSTAEDNRIIKFLGTDATEDRAGEVVTTDGWELENYMKNPVFLWAHDYSLPPVGKAVAVSLTEGGLEFDIQFATKEEYPFAETIYNLYKGGYLNAVSVGFRGKDGAWKDGVYHITRKELYELSGVPVPANPNALARAVEKGIISDGERIKMDSDTYKIASLEERVADLERMVLNEKENAAHDKDTNIYAGLLDELAAVRDITSHSTSKTGKESATGIDDVIQSIQHFKGGHNDR